MILGAERMSRNLHWRPLCFDLVKNRILVTRFSFTKFNSTKILGTDQIVIE